MLRRAHHHRAEQMAGDNFPGPVAVEELRPKKPPRWVARVQEDMFS